MVFLGTFYIHIYTVYSRHWKLDLLVQRSVQTNRSSHSIYTLRRWCLHMVRFHRDDTATGILQWLTQYVNKYISSHPSGTNNAAGNCNLASRPITNTDTVCNLCDWALLAETTGGTQGFKMLDPEDGGITLLRNMGKYRRLPRRMQLTYTAWVEFLNTPYDRRGKTYRSRQKHESLSLNEAVF
jgi:hypothetical protein